MPDMEKVIKGLKELSGFLFKEYGKAQAEEASLYYDRFLTVDNALALLKEQEAVVRCCDCEHWDSQCHSCEHFDGIMQPDFYCADGVKRDD